MGYISEDCKEKLQVTTQRGIRHVLHPSFSQICGTNEQAFQYLRLLQNLFGDTLIAGTTSKSGNKYAEVFELI